MQSKRKTNYMQNKIRVKDHNKFRLFDYLNEPNSLVKLGEVVTYNSEPNKLGVIIQTFGDGILELICVAILVLMKLPSAH